AIPENIGHKTSKPIRQFITAGSADETVPDHSVFREQFVAALEGEADTDKDGYVTGAELGEFLHKTVVNYSRSAQHPQYGKIRDPRLDKGDFVFPLRTAGLAPPGAGQADLPQERQRLEDERAQLEAERKKLEEEKKRMEVASLPRVNFDAGLAAYNRKDYAAALRNFKPLAEQGNGDAQVWLGHMYENGFGAPQDLEQATAWYRKAAEQGHAGGQYHLGLMYEFAMGVPQDLDQAMAWYRKAADQGHSEAMSFLKNAEKKRLETASLPRGDLAAGKAAFERSDFAAALRNFKPLAEQGNAEAQFRVGVLYHLYHKEMGTPQDDALAVTWYRKAAEQGHVGAQNNLGDMYLGGRGVPQDNTQGVALIRKAAEQGYAAAQRHLGTLYEGGSIIPRDLEQAKTWYRKAAEQGDFLAAEFLKGLMKGR
ncbi:MAG: sel1 repeat family protein, partial [Nitrospinae bacterium]|nr:sel1 repeat family protein [Nitrospinota bacterium]